MKLSVLIKLLVLVFLITAEKASAGHEYVTLCRDPAVPPGENANDDEGQLGYPAWVTKVIEHRLKSLRYDPGEIDGKVDPQFVCALMTFQKMNGLERSGRINPQVLDAMEDPVYPVHRQKHSGIHVEADLKRQIVTVYLDDEILCILPMSSGADKPFKEPGGGYGTAKTPLGNFTFFSRIWGLHADHLGDLFNPVYFDRGGYAVHGDTFVPAYNASHGCLRIPIKDSEWFVRTVPLGSPILVSKSALPSLRLK